MKKDILTKQIASGNFDQKIKALDDMGTRWTDAVLPTIYNADMYPEGEQEYVDDYNSTVKAGKIVDNPDATTEHIREQAKARAAESAKSKEIIQAYTGGTTV